MSKQRITGNQSGFTIIELMIATAILSTILLMVTVIMISIGSLYYKGVSTSEVQDSVRNVADEITQDLQLSSSPPIPVSETGERAYCIGNQRFTYTLYHQIGGQPTQSPHVLWRDTNPEPNTCDTSGPIGSATGLPNLANNPPSAGGTELVAPSSRLTNFSITGSSPYTLSLGMAYGDDDLLCDNGVPNDCIYYAGVSAGILSLLGGSSPHGQITCKIETGNQFCATADLTTTVAQRLTP